ncbi:MAG: DNA/RNA nuclease SfsA [Anaerolineae bacterium]
MCQDQTLIEDICLTFGPLIRARYVDRINRFLIQATIEGRRVTAYLANPGRLEELLVTGRAIWLKAASTTGRKTAFDAVLIQHPESLVSLDSHLPNRLVDLALRRGALPGFDASAHIQREASRGASRLDFLLRDDTQQPHWLEVKSVTLVENGIAGFPDAPTQRGRRHLQELKDAVQSGEEASVFFVVQRDDATGFKPYDATDPDFGSALREAARAGVGVQAFTCHVTLQSICFDKAVPIHLDGPTR